MLGRGGNEDISEKGIHPRFFAFSSRPPSGINKTKNRNEFLDKQRTLPERLLSDLHRGKGVEI